MGATEEDIQVSASMFDLKRRRRKRQKKGEKGQDHAYRRDEKGEQLDLLRRFIYGQQVTGRNAFHSRAGGQKRC